MTIYLVWKHMFSNSNELLWCFKNYRESTILEILKFLYIKLKHLIKTTTLFSRTWRIVWIVWNILGFWNYMVICLASFIGSSQYDQDSCLTHPTFGNSKILLMAEILLQLIGSWSYHLHGFILPRWCRISSGFLPSTACSPNWTRLKKSPWWLKHLHPLEKIFEKLLPPQYEWDFFNTPVSAPPMGDDSTEHFPKKLAQQRNLEKNANKRHKTLKTKNMLIMIYIGWGMFFVSKYIWTGIPTTSFEIPWFLRGRNRTNSPLLHASAILISPPPHPPSHGSLGRLWVEYTG